MELLKKYFDTALESPDGVKKLRQLILSLAMQGKLVKQDPNDQPASELLKEIQAEKERLIAEGKIKKQKELPPINPEEVPYAVPEVWEWVRLGEICQQINGDRSSRYPNDTDLVDYGVPFFGAKDMTNGLLSFDDVRFISEAKFSELSSGKLEDKDFVMLLRGTVGKISAFHATKEFKSGFINAQMLIIRLYLSVIHEFFAKFSSSTVFINKIEAKITGSAIRQMPANVVPDFIIPLPPLAEQKRIVAKIDQLMTLCNTLEQQRAERNQKRRTVHVSALHHLLNASNKREFDNSWRFIRSHFDELYSVKENVVELKKAILSLAMQGKLVKQDPNDQPASELLKEIKTEKERLIKEGKIKKQKELSPIKPEEVPYEVPEGWSWTRLGEVASYNGRDNAKPNDINNDTWVLDLEDIEKDTSRVLYRAKYSERQSKSNKSLFQKGDVLYGKLRPYLNKVVVADCSGVCTTEIVPIVPTSAISSEFLLWLLKRPAFISHVNSLSYGVKMPRLGTDDAANSMHPLPSLAEQKRIVTKIDQLMIICDALERQICDSTAKQTALLNAIVGSI